MNIYKLVFESYGEILSEDFFFHKENAVREAHSHSQGFRAESLRGKGC